MRISDWSSDVCSSDLLGDGAQRVEAAGDGGEEALLRLHVGGDRPEQRRLRLVGAVGTPETLDRRVRLPAGFEQVVDAQAAVPGAERSAERRVGQACVSTYRSRWSPEPSKKKTL